jgi:hypothetical protein
MWTMMLAVVVAVAVMMMTTMKKRQKVAKVYANVEYCMLLQLNLLWILKVTGLLTKITFAVKIKQMINSFEAGIVLPKQEAKNKKVKLDLTRLGVPDDSAKPNKKKQHAAKIDPRTTVTSR